MATTATLVIGAGPIGATLALRLAAAGEPVRIGTRSGSGPEHPLVERVRLDAGDPDAVARAADGCDVIHHCAHTAYSAAAWRRDLAPAEAVVLDAARRSGATVVFPESLYGFDAATMPITESTALTATTGKRGVRVELISARQRSGARCRSVAASDYYGPGAGANAHAGDRMIAPMLTGRTVRPLGSADQPHSFTFLPDLAEAMIAAAALPDPGHRLLLAPTAPAVTQRELIRAYANAAGAPMPKVSPLRPAVVRAVGTLHGGTREIAELLYQFDRPFAMDSSRSEAELGLAPTPLAGGAALTIASLSAR